jgi:hypothetical protein
MHIDPLSGVMDTALCSLGLQLAAFRVATAMHASIDRLIA